MSDKEILVEKCVEQIENGSHYRGHLKIKDTIFDYELRLAVTIDELEDKGNVESTEEARGIYQLTVKKDGTTIKLLDDEYWFFYKMLLPLIVNFYFEQQTCGVNQGSMGEILRGEGPLADPSAIGEILRGVPADSERIRQILCGEVVPRVITGMICQTSKESYNFPHDLCEMLSDSKFGCKLI